VSATQLHSKDTAPILLHKPWHPWWQPCALCKGLAEAKGHRILAFLILADGLRWIA